MGYGALHMPRLPVDKAVDAVQCGEGLGQTPRDVLLTWCPCAAIVSKPGWQAKMKKPNILKKWKMEAKQFCSTEGVIDRAVAELEWWGLGAWFCCPVAAKL